MQRAPSYLFCSRNHCRRASGAWKKTDMWKGFQSRGFTEEKLNEPREPAFKHQMKETSIRAVRADGKSNRWFEKVDISHHQIANEEGWLVLLDKRVIRTPQDNKLLIPSQKLALMVAAEWDSQSSKVQPLTMPMMTLCSTAIDLVPTKRGIILDSLLSLLKTDVVCCRHTDPPVIKKQEAAHDPLVQWFSQEFKVPKLSVTSDLSVQHKEEILTTIQWLLYHADDWLLAGLDTLSVNAKSLVISLALWKDRVTLQQAIEASRIEEEHQIGLWGEVQGRGGHDMDRAVITMRLSAAKLFLDLLPEKYHKIRE